MGILQPYRFPYAKFPAVRIALLLAAGIMIGAHAGLSPRWWTVLLFTLAALFLFSSLLSASTLSTGWYRLKTGLYLLLIIVFGAGWHSFFTQQSGQAPPSKTLLDRFVWQKVEFSGIIQKVRMTSTGKYQVDVEIDTTTFSHGIHWKHPYRLRTFIQPDKIPGSPNSQLRLGRRIRYAGTVYPLEGKKNPHQFDYKSYLAGENIYNQAGLDTLYALREEADLSWSSVRQSAIDLIDKCYPPRTAPLAKALLLGYRDELDKKEKQSFSRSGLSHIMAVSGLHVGFLLVPFWWIIPYFWSFRYGPLAAFFVLGAFLFFYAGLTGFTASVTRASLTGALIMYSRLFNKVRDPFNLTALAAVIILLRNPAELFDIGFQLSFSAVYIILLTLPVINSLLPARFRHRWFTAPAKTILISLLVQFGLYPLIGHYFGEFSLVGPLANAIVVPLLAVVVPFGLFLLPLSALWPAVGRMLTGPIDAFFACLSAFAGFSSSWQFGWIHAAEPGAILFLIWASAIALIAACRTPRLRWKLAVALMILCSIQQGLVLYRTLGRPLLSVTVFDVGQGDAILIRTPNKKHMLIDTGPWAPGYNPARHIILPHLRARGITELEAVFLSHPHADHIGGISELMDNVSIKTIYNSGLKHDTNLYRNYLRKAGRLNIPVKALSAGDTVAPDPSLRIFVYGPHYNTENTGPDPNDHSLIIEMVYGKTEFLFMGDAGVKQEGRLISRYGNLLKTDLLKVGHHGSKTSTSRTFLKTVRPRISVISLDMHNRFRHPHRKTVDHLFAAGTELFFTSLEGALVFVSDGHRIERNRW